MPEARYIHPAIGVIDSVDNAIGADDDFAKRRIIELGNYATQLGIVGEALGAAEEKTGRSEWRALMSPARCIGRCLAGRAVRKARGLLDNP
jgi:hypothetical protein